MQFRCPTCGFRGSIKITHRYPRGHRVTIRCSKCRQPFALAIGQLFPQPSPSAYEALVPGSAGCKGELVGSLWLEVVGPESDRSPLLAFPSHPSFSHELLHDLLDPYREYFRVGYLELPGTRRNPRGTGTGEPLEAVEESLAQVMRHLGATRVHLLGHLTSCSLVLEIARRHSEAVVSATLIDPDLTFRERLAAIPGSGQFGKLREGDLAGIRRPELVLELLEFLWPQAGKELAPGTAGGPAGEGDALARFHREGLASILAAGISPEQLRRDLTTPGSAMPYARLARLKPPVLVFAGRDCPVPLRNDALYLRSSVPSAELAPLEKGGAWSAWISNHFFANKLLAHKRSSERQRERRRTARSRRQTLAGQPLGWMIFLYLLIAWGLTLGFDRLPVQPAYMARVLPPLLGGLLPILWLLAPRGLGLLRFLRFRGFVPRNIFPPLIGGALLGAAFRCLLLSQGGLRRPAAIPDVLLSLPPGAPGRTAALAALAASVLLVFGVAENLLLLRRLAGRILIPALLFVLIPLSYPDLLWQVPAGLGAALLFSRSLSLAPPLALLAGVIGAAEADSLYGAIPFSLEGVNGLAAAAAVFAAAVLLALLPGRRRRGFSPEALYYTVGTPREEKGFRWRAGSGVVLVVFSLIAAAILVFGSLGA